MMNSTLAVDADVFDGSVTLEGDIDFPYPGEVRWF
jgi:hypothetical protein